MLFKANAWVFRRAYASTEDVSWTNQSERESTRESIQMKILGCRPLSQARLLTVLVRCAIAGSTDRRRWFLAPLLGRARRASSSERAGGAQAAIV